LYEIERSGHDSGRRHDGEYHHGNHDEVADGPDHPHGGSHPWRRQGLHCSHVATETLNQIVGVHPSSIRLSVRRSDAMARCVAIFNAPILIPVSADASFSESSRNLSNSTAWRCPGGNASMACAKASGSPNVSSELFATGLWKVTSRSSTPTSCAPWRTRRRPASASR